MSDRAAHFAGEWLALREPADHAARSGGLAEILARGLAGTRKLEVLDLGAGTGSNLRWLAPRLPFDQDWLLLDHDTALLDRAESLSAASDGGGSSIRVRTHRIDLAELSPRLFEDAGLVTASALFDLVSEAWVRELADRVAGSGAAALFALTVDGRRWFTDFRGALIDDEHDRWMCDLFNRHQCRAKGLGAALGPEAARMVPAALDSVGMQVQVDRADWHLAAGLTTTAALGEALLEDWAGAALEQSPEDAQSIEAWLRRRRAGLEAGTVGIGIGHVDVLALPLAHG